MFGMFYQFPEPVPDWYYQYQCFTSSSCRLPLMSPLPLLPVGGTGSTHLSSHRNWITSSTAYLVPRAQCVWGQNRTKQQLKWLLFKMWIIICGVSSEPKNGLPVWPLPWRQVMIITSVNSWWYLHNSCLRQWQWSFCSAMADKVEEWDQREEQGSGNPAYDSPALKDPGWHGNLTNFMIIKKSRL